MNNLKNFFMTAFIGGLVAVLPVAILLNLLLWLLEWVTEMITPVTGIVIATTSVNEWLAKILAILVVIFSCFALGVIVRTAWGSWLHDKLEAWFFTRIPGYSLVKDLFSKLAPGQSQGFSRPVLVSLDNSEVEFLGFITEEYDDQRYAVFIPTSPSPMNGFVIQVRAENLRFVETTADEMMKTVISCGVGSQKIVQRVRT